MPLTFFIHLPMKIEPIRSSETSAIKTQTPGNYPKRKILQDGFSFLYAEMPRSSEIRHFKSCSLVRNIPFYRSTDCNTQSRHISSYTCGRTT